MEYSLYLLIPTASLFLVAGLLGYIIGRDQAAKTERRPTDRYAAAALFGNDASLWSMTRTGWEIGPVKGYTIVKVPRWYSTIRTFSTGGTYVSGVAELNLTRDLSIGESLELIPPIGY